MDTDTIKMLYDGYDCVADYDNSGTPALLRYYITPGLDENLLVYDEETTDEEYFYIHDGLGTVRQILDDTQNVENQYDYEGFGTSLSSTENIYNRFRYTGRELDIETESANSSALYYYRARTYDSTIGSFTSRDPIPHVNLYPYCSSNPINFIDPLGLHQNLDRPLIDFSKIGKVVDLGVYGHVQIISAPNLLSEGKSINEVYFTLHHCNYPSTICKKCCEFGWVNYKWQLDYVRSEGGWKYDNNAWGDEISSPIRKPGNRVDLERKGSGTGWNSRWKNNPWYGDSYENLVFEASLVFLRSELRYLEEFASFGFGGDYLESIYERIEEIKKEMKQLENDFSIDPQPSSSIVVSECGKYITQLVCASGEDKGKVYVTIKWTNRASGADISSITTHVTDAELGY